MQSSTETIMRLRTDSSTVAVMFGREMEGWLSVAALDSTRCIKAIDSSLAASVSAPVELQGAFVFLESGCVLQHTRRVRGLLF